MEILKNIKTADLVNELCSRDQYSLKFALIELMLDNKISYSDLTTAYNSAIKQKIENNERLLQEVDTCMNMLLSKTKEKDITDRCIYVLDILGHYKNDALKEKYKYDPVNGAKNSTI